MMNYKVYVIIVNHPNSGRMYVGYTRQDLDVRLSQNLEVDTVFLLLYLFCYLYFK